MKLCEKCARQRLLDRGETSSHVDRGTVARVEAFCFDALQAAKNQVVR